MYIAIEGYLYYKHATNHCVIIVQLYNREEHAVANILTSDHVESQLHNN